MRPVVPGQRIFAIGLNGWVELQTSSSPPKAKTSTVKRSQKVKVFDYAARDFYWDHGYYRSKLVRKTLTMKAVIYTGGKVLTTLKARRFAALTKISLHNGGMFELSPDLINLLISKGVLSVKGTSTVVSPPTQPPPEPSPAGPAAQEDPGAHPQAVGESEGD